MVIQGVSYPSDFEAKKQMIEIGRRMEEKGYVIAGDGSLSVRVGPNAVWLTAEGADKGALKQENFIRVDMNGKQSPGSRQTRLPEDLAVHLAVYDQNPALRGVIHGYPAGAAVFAAQGREVPASDYTPSVRTLGRISLIPFGNAEEEAKAAALVCKTDSGVLISGNGCMMWGESLAEAFHKIQALEYCVKIRSMMEVAAAPSGCGPSSGFAPAPLKGTVPQPVPAAVCGAGAAMGACAGEEIEGLTPIIRPGDECGLPGGESGLVSATASSGRSGSASATALPGQGVSAPAAALPGQWVSAPAAASSGQCVSAPAVSGQPGQGVPAAAPSGAAVRREQMMAEVVRRSLASL